MFTLKNNYYLYIENSKILNLNLIKKRDKFIVIYRNNGPNEKISQLKDFRRKCKQKSIKFYVANNYNLSVKLKADGLYLSSYNKDLNLMKLKNLQIKIIGSAHNIKEIFLKKKQGCEKIIFSRLFKTNYSNKKGFLGVNRFNLINNHHKNKLIPLGGIKLKNLTKINIINSKSFGILSEIKKKPAKILSRLF
jgi:Thiamine monophosphate synthase